MPTERTTEDYALVGLSLIKGLGPHKIKVLLKAFGSADSVLGRRAHELRRIPGIGAKIAGAITSFTSLEVCKRQFEIAEAVGAFFVKPDEIKYPQLLRQIFDPPPFLWMTSGDSFEWKTPVAIVGTRRPSSYGQHVTQVIARELSGAGFAIISGLAHGIDAVAHDAVVKSGGQTVAFLGSGLDRIYPRNHRRLAENIVDCNGAVISSFPFGTEPDAPNFPQRNRLISGSSTATIVTEAYSKGGALITARFALDQDRDVFAVPGPVGSPASEGTNKLIQDGTARLLLAANEVVEELTPSMPTTRIDSSLFRNLNPAVTDEDRKVLDVLEYSPRHLDEICKDSQCQVGFVLGSLLRLELIGCVQDCGGNLYARQ